MTAAVHLPYIFRTDVGRDNFNIDVIDAGHLSVNGDIAQAGRER